MAYIGIDRGIVKHWIYEDAEYFKVWFEILYRARFSYEPERKMLEGKLITIEYGQFIFGRTSWSDRLKVSEQRLRTLFKKLQDDEMIEVIQRFPKFSLYSVKNYEKYNQQSNQQQDQSKQWFSGDANQQNNNGSTSNQPAANQQLTTQEELSNNAKPKVTRKNNKTYTPEFDEFWNVYPRKIGKLEAFKTWERIIKNGESATTIILCASNYAQDCVNRQTAEQYIKHPKTFLNDERYKDFMVIVLSQPKSGYEKTKSKLDQMLAEEEAKRNGTGRYYQTGTDHFG